jgi:D-serine deaminase-like pyridoxal phosphate-dependent protein
MVAPRTDGPMPSTFAELETPAAVVDLDRLEANLERMAAYAHARGIALRPHAKTHKTAWLAAEQARRGAVGVTVATLREAEVMADAVDDVLLAYPPVGQAKLQRLLRLPERLRLTVALDSGAALDALSGAVAAAGRRIGVLVEVDAGMRRVGIGDPHAAAGLAARAAQLPGIEYRGILFYPGHIREPVPEQGPALARLADAVDGFRSALAAAGLEPTVVSGGSTPAAWGSHTIPGLTEMRPGTYIFNDRTTALVGACAWEDCAYTLATTVVSTAVPGQAVVDAGTKALAREELRSPGGAGYGALVDRPEVRVAGMSEEHGLLDLSGTGWRPRIGDVVRIVPNHVCVSVHLQDRVWGVRGEEVVCWWPVEARGR